MDRKIGNYIVENVMQPDAATDVTLRDLEGGLPGRQG
jgi:hypothetical protein